jgi:tetratricopeptide (TPR) repeat protein
MNRTMLAAGWILAGMLGAGCPPSAGPSRPDDARALRPASEAEVEAFRARGLDAPETRLGAGDERTAPLDLALIREAIAEARELSSEEQARLEAREGRDREALTGASPEAAEAAPMRAESARPAAAPPPAPMEMAKEQVAKLEVDGQAPDTKAKKRDEGGGAKDALGEEPDGPGKTVLKAIQAAPREPKILARDEDGKLKPLLLRELRVVAYLEGPRARTVVDAVFENRATRDIEGTFYFPLPAEASPVGFAMFAGAPRLDAARLFEGGRSLPRLPEDSITPPGMEAFAPAGTPPAGQVGWAARQEARVVEQKRAREVYEEIVRQSVDPALLEWAGGNTFQARVFPLPAGSLKRVVLVYEQTLPFDGRFLRYTFPLPEARLPSPVTARVHLEPTLGEARAVGLGADMRAVVPRPRSQAGLSVWDLVQEEAAGALNVAVEPRDPRAHVLAGPDPGGLPGQAFFARLRPAVSEGLLEPTGSALFVVDTSLSGEDGRAHELQAGLLRELLAQDASIERYAVLLFDVRPRWLHGPGWRENTPEARARSLAELEKVYLEGATNLDAVLADLDRQDWLAGGARPPTAFLLSDGQITWGQAEATALTKRHPSARALRWICYRFGDNAANQALFDELTRDSAGRTVTVLSQAEIPAATTAHRKAAAQLRSVRVEGAQVTDLVVAGEPRLLFPGQELQVSGRLVGDGPARLVVEASLAGQDLRQAAELPRGTAHRLAPRAAAELLVRRLLGLDDERLDRMIVALSQHHLLANARASLLILEDEGSYARYEIRTEQVDLANLERLRAQEEDQRLDRLQGLDLDQASPLARRLVTGLRDLAGRLEPPLRPQPLLDQPFSGGEARLQAELAYRAARKQDRMDVMVYDGIARARALAGDTLGAVRALSCTVELRPQDTEATRLVGYGLLALGQYEPAAELFERARLLRPFEGQVYLEEALALDGAGRLGEAARRYEIALSRSWRRHDEQIKTVASFHYARLLQAVAADRGLPPELAAAIRQRLGELRALTGEGRIDYQFTTHWSTDGIDIDLWVIEPDGTKCYYGHKETALGGKLWWDITDGLGPELYHMQKASRGEYVVAVHYYGNNSPRLAVPTALLLVADRDVFGPEDRYTRRIQMRMLPKRDAVLELRRERL